MERSIVVVALMLSGCVIAPARILGDQCDLSSECDAPLVCALGRCRNECAGTRDCPLGLRCVKASASQGVCLLADETECGLTSDCPETLVCAMTECVNECEDETDCVPGARCTEGSCVEVSVDRCAYPSECLYPLTCTDGLCVSECRDDADCDPGRTCFTHATCGGGPCMCRFDCSVDPCPNPGTVCTADGFCERDSVEIP